MEHNQGKNLKLYNSSSRIQS
ncbi:hypothetical protein CP8484711_0925A, partial [Chlamydia psittaci 84-8471/1]